MGWPARVIVARRVSPVDQFYHDHYLMLTKIPENGKVFCPTSKSVPPYWDGAAAVIFNGSNFPEFRVLPDLFPGVAQAQARPLKFIPGRLQYTKISENLHTKLGAILSLTH